MAQVNLEEEYTKILNQKTEKEDTTTKRADKVVQGTVKRKKLTKTESFCSEHVTPLVKLVATEYILPAAKDAIISCVEIMLFGEAKKKRGGRNGHVAYESISSRGRSFDSRRTMSRRDRATHNFDTISFDSKLDADNVLDQLLFLCEKFGAASVADFYDLVGVEQTSADQNYGWTDLRSARVKHTRDGWIIDIERPYFLD